MNLDHMLTNGIPKQKQEKQPGLEKEMNPVPVYEDENYKGTNKLAGKVALITGGDSGIGGAVAIGYAKEGAHIGIVYLDEHEGAEDTKTMVEKHGVNCIKISGDIAEESFCISSVERCVSELGGLDILVNNAAEQHPVDDLRELTDKQLKRTFETNFFSYVYYTKAALDYLQEGSSIINTSSINAYRGNVSLIDYTSTKGAITAFTRSMAQALADKKIRVNSVAPGPIWTPLIPASFDEEKVANFGQDNLMRRPGQPSELVGAYVLLASQDSSYMTGQAIHINGGDYISS
ncbi:oxidoreductase, short chain dehydrogenase/reductase family [Bacillus sp. JCM 19046]|nr:oxidoreductase, short chain dehydrogenase/reductase family [Bacillus sp. JCM 19045]GAF18796.1 oxidoreductase, short chain dehydrogenase/reductase family [Bacillus sp. JCM 19046]